VQAPDITVYVIVELPMLLGLKVEPETELPWKVPPAVVGTKVTTGSPAQYDEFRPVKDALAGILTFTECEVEELHPFCVIE
jgi:hypothetical protein